MLLKPELDNVKNTVMNYMEDWNTNYPSMLGWLDTQAIRALYGGPSKDGQQVAHWKWQKAKQILTQVGKVGADKLFGTAVKDVIEGQAGNDKLYGFGGNDSLHGGYGNDVLVGGDGNDQFIVDTPLDATSNVDRIVDFESDDDGFSWSGPDRIVLSSFIFSTLPNGMLGYEAFADGTKAESEQTRIVYDEEGTGDVFYDPDGSGPLAQIQFLTLKNKPHLDERYFYIV